MARTKLTNRLVEKKSAPSREQKQADYWDTEVPGFGLRIGHGGRRTFIVMLRVAGRQRRFTLGTYPEMSLKEAREAATTARADARKGIDPREREQERQRQAERQRLRVFPK